MQVGHSVAVGCGDGVLITGGVGVAWLQVTHGVFVGMTGGVGVAWLQVTHGVFVGMTGSVGVAWLQMTHVGVGDGRHGRGVRVGVDVDQLGGVRVGVDVDHEHTGQQVASCVCIATNVPQKSGVETTQASVGTTITMVVAFGVGIAVGVAIAVGIAVGVGVITDD